MKKIIFSSVIVCLLCFVLFVLGQEKIIDNNDQQFYWVVFKDKVNMFYMVDVFEVFLFLCVIVRRQKLGILVIMEDFLFNFGYLKGIIEVGVKVYYIFCWFNVVIIYGELVMLLVIKFLFFVDIIWYVGFYWVKGKVSVEWDVKMDKLKSKVLIGQYYGYGIK